MLGFLISIALGGVAGLALSRTAAGKEIIRWTLERWETLEGRKRTSKAMKQGRGLMKDFWNKLKGHDYLEESRKSKGSPPPPTAKPSKKL